MHVLHSKASIPVTLMHSDMISAWTKHTHHRYEWLWCTLIWYQQVNKAHSAAWPVTLMHSDMISEWTKLTRRRNGWLWTTLIWYQSEQSSLSIVRRFPLPLFSRIFRVRGNHSKGCSSTIWRDSSKLKTDLNRILDELCSHVIFID